MWHEAQRITKENIVEVQAKQSIITIKIPSWKSIIWYNKRFNSTKRNAQCPMKI